MQPDHVVIIAAVVEICFRVPEGKALPDNLIDRLHALLGAPGVLVSITVVVPSITETRNPNLVVYEVVVSGEALVKVRVSKETTSKAIMVVLAQAEDLSSSESMALAFPSESLALAEGIHVDTKFTFTLGYLWNKAFKGLGLHGIALLLMGVALVIMVLLYIHLTRIGGSDWKLLMMLLLLFPSLATVLYFTAWLGNPCDGVVEEDDCNATIDLETFNNLFLAQVCVLLVSGCATVLVNIKLLSLRRKSSTQEEWVEWVRQQSRLALAVVLCISAFNTTFLNLDCSKLFGLGCLDGPKDKVWVTRNGTYSLLSVVTYNIPCLVIQLYVLFNLKECSTINVVLPLVLSTSSAVCILISHLVKVCDFRKKKDVRKMSRKSFSMNGIEGIKNKTRQSSVLRRSNRLSPKFISRQQSCRDSDVSDIQSPMGRARFASAAESFSEGSEVEDYNENPAYRLPLDGLDVLDAGSGVELVDVVEDSGGESDESDENEW